MMSDLISNCKEVERILKEGVNMGIILTTESTPENDMIDLLLHEGLLKRDNLVAKTSGEGKELLRIGCKKYIKRINKKRELTYKNELLKSWQMKITLIIGIILFLISLFTFYKSL